MGLKTSWIDAGMVWGCWDGMNVFCMQKGHEFSGGRRQNVIDWIMSLQNPYVETITSNMIIFGNKAFKEEEVIEVELVFS